MINLPPRLTPSELLCCEELPLFIDELLQGSRARRKEGGLREAERCALDVIEASQEPEAIVSRGMALLHLADAHREMGKLGPALTDCQRAYPIFQRQLFRCQRHNAAVAAYALGLVHQLLGNEMDALKWYREADQLFDRIRSEWAAVNAPAHVGTCVRIRRWMKTLSEYLTALRTRPDVNPVTRIWVPIMPADVDAGEFAIAELDIDKYTVGRQLTVNGRVFDAYRLRGNHLVVMEPGAEYYALEIPREVCESLGADEGDYALVRREKNADEEGPGVLETPGGPTFGDFERDDDGNVNFVRRDARVIGGDDIGEDLQVGYIAGLLKPT